MDILGILVLLMFLVVTLAFIGCCLVCGCCCFSNDAAIPLTILRHRAAGGSTDKPTRTINHPDGGTTDGQEVKLSGAAARVLKELDLIPAGIEVEPRRKNSKGRKQSGSSSHSGRGARGNKAKDFGASSLSKGEESDEELDQISVDAVRPDKIVFEEAPPTRKPRPPGDLTVWAEESAPQLASNQKMMRGGVVVSI
ncbi:unnamed protein product [Amoebophrya sp. A120]|nr:unnamed protein product [Amoebophrya sp. A120]|eukprot:GSA120T00011569001.1